MCVITFELSFACSVIKYKIAFYIISYYQHYSYNRSSNYDSTRIEDVCNAYVFYLETYYIVCELHSLELFIVNDSLSLNTTVFQVKYYRFLKQIRKLGPHIPTNCKTVILKYYTTYSLRPLLFEMHVTCRGATYPIIKPHEPHK